MAAAVRLAPSACQHAVTHLQQLQRLFGRVVLPPPLPPLIDVLPATYQKAARGCPGDSGDRHGGEKRQGLYCAT